MSQIPSPLLLRFGEFELDEGTFELRRGGAALAVQPKVLDLIVYLARHRDRVVTKDELLRELWSGVAVSEASLSQAVSAARRALGDSSTEPAVLRTVRGKGFRFVAAAEPVASISLTETLLDTERQTQARAALGSLFSIPVPESEVPSTDVDSSRGGAMNATFPHLFVILRADAPRDLGAAVSLVGVRAVHIGRGTERRVTHAPDGKAGQVLLTLPGDALSRRHARLVLDGERWTVEDLGSSNGTWLDGKRVQGRQALAMGDVLEVGHTLLTLGTHQRITGLDPEVDARAEPASLLGSVLPELRALERDLLRVAGSAQDVWIEGEAGVGKSALARELHGISARPGPLVVLRATDTDVVELEREVARARGGALLLETVDELLPEHRARLAALLLAVPEVRVLATSRASYAQCFAAQGAPELLQRFGGFRCSLPPLRHRLADLGTLLVRVLGRQSAGDVTLDAAAALALARHTWPGNLPELEACVRAARELAGAPRLELSHLPPALRGLG